VTVVDVTAAVAKELVHFPKGFHHDPADRLIVATARALDLPLLTGNRAIGRSGLIRL
jgi:PIN domain nuclease of toxin-antitoxin system